MAWAVSPEGMRSMPIAFDAIKSAPVAPANAYPSSLLKLIVIFLKLFLIILISKKFKKISYGSSN